MSTSNNPLDLNATTIKCLSERVTMAKAANKYHINELEKMTGMWLDRGLEIENLMNRIARLEQQLEEATK